MRRWYLLRADAAWGPKLVNAISLPEPETIMWYSLLFVVALLAFLKGIGVLLLSWWWILLPLVTPFLALATLLLVVLLLKLAEVIIK